MTSLVKKSYKLGKAVYATVNEVMSEPHKPPQQTHQGYAPAQIPGQFTSHGQHHPLPPRPPTNAPPNAQGYGSSPVYGQQGYPPASQGPPPPHDQTNYIPPAGPVYNQTAYSAPYGAHPPPSPAMSYSHVQNGPQTTGTIPATPSSGPPQPSWSPSYPPTTNTSPFAHHNPYTPPTPSSAPAQPFPPQPITNLPPPPNAPTQPLAHQHAGNTPSPPLSPPMAAPLTAQPYAPPQQAGPFSPAISPATIYNGYPVHQPYMHSSSPPPPHSAPPINQPSPPPHMQTPVSPASAFSPRIPHPPAFVAELPAHIQYPSHNPANSMPEGVVELPAELPADLLTKASAETRPPSASPSTTPPTIPATAVTQSSTVEQPNPVHPSAQQGTTPPPAPYAPQTYSPAQSTQIPPSADNSYHAYHPVQIAPTPDHAPSPPNSQPGSYMPYAPPSHYPPPYPVQPIGESLVQQPGVPSRMGSLAQKIQHINISNPQSNYPYQATAPLDTKSPQGPAVGQQGIVGGGSIPNGPSPPYVASW